MKLWLTVLMLLLTGCAIRKNGVAHYLVIGFGIVNVNQTNQAAQVTSAQAVGVYCSDAPGAKFVAGYVKQTTTSIRTNSNITLELK